MGYEVPKNLIQQYRHYHLPTPDSYALLKMFSDYTYIILGNILYIYFVRV